MSKIRAGDHVRVGNETLLAACDEEDGRFVNLGWPERFVEIERATVVKRASDDERVDLLSRVVMSNSRSTLCTRIARRQWLRDHTRSWREFQRFEDGPFRPFPSAAHSNRAGEIQNVVEGSFAGVALIRSVEGAVRSNHWHRTDSHHLHVVSGTMLYWEQDPGFSGETRPFLVEPGFTVWTGPGAAHATAFLEPTLLLSVSTLPRDKRSHEADVVRHPVVCLEQLLEAAPWIDWKFP